MGVTSPARAGFTLIEALMALAVFAIGVGALMPLTLSNLRANHNAAVRTRAVTLAQEELERFRATAFPDLPASGSAGAPQAIDGVYTRQWFVTPVPAALPGDGADLKRIRVTVTWDTASSNGEVTLVTAKTRY